jgi:hypothetical protein
MPAYTKVPVACLVSSSVGSSQISLPMIHYGECDQQTCKRVPIMTLTAEHDITRPNISIPASARAVLAATEPDATHPSIPSLSMTMIKISIVDFGRSSSLTEESNAWWICTATDRSSASYNPMYRNKRVQTRKTKQLTRIGALLRPHEKGVNLTSTFRRPFSLYVVLLDCRGPYLGKRLWLITHL